MDNSTKTEVILNSFFCNIKNLSIPQYNETESLSQKIGDSLMKTVLKYRSHPRINLIKENGNSNLCSSFYQIERDEIIKEINNLKRNKATQSTDIPTKLIKENSDIFVNLILETVKTISHYVFQRH